MLAFPPRWTSARAADVAVIVAGDRAGLFGRGTSGEGCDVESLELPGVQRQLIEAVLATGTPVVLVLMTGRPYAVGWAVEAVRRRNPDVLPWRRRRHRGGGRADWASEPVGPSTNDDATINRRPAVHLPALGARRRRRRHVRWHGARAAVWVWVVLHRIRVRTAFVGSQVLPDGEVTASVTVTNIGDRPGEDVVQLYVHDVVGSVARPAAQLVGFQRVALAAGQSATVTFSVPSARLAFSDRSLTRVVEPGEFEAWVGDAESRLSEAKFTVIGSVRAVGEDDRRITTSSVLTLTGGVSPRS